MSWGYLALPAELQDRTLVFIAPVLAKPRVKATLSNQLETDIDSVFECAKNIKDFALTCKAVFKRCAPFLYDVRSLKCGRERVLIEEHPDGTVYPVLKFTTRLALNGPGVRPEDNITDEMEVDQDVTPSNGEAQLERNKPLTSDNMTKLERSIETLFNHCAPIVLLKLTDFPLTVMNLWSLKLLKKLQTLSICSPKVIGLIPNVAMIHRVCAMPHVTKLNLIMNDMEETTTMSNVVKLFEHSIQVLSITGADYGIGAYDSISKIFFNDVHRVHLPSLRHINIDFLEFDVIGLRKLIIASPNLESILLDCRGIDGFLPLFYAVDLIRIIIKEAFDVKPVLKYEDRPDPGFGVPEDRYSDGKLIWDAYLSRICLRFKVVGTPKGPAKVLDAAAFKFATGDTDLDLINKDIKFAELADVFRARMGTFRHLTKFTAFLEGHPDFVPLEDNEQVKKLTLRMCRESLPSVETFTVNWGRRKVIRWTPHVGIQESDQVDVWSSGGAVAWSGAE